MIYQNYQDQHHEQGYIYLMEAVGYHGIFPGCYLRRCKIGLSRNPQARLENFHANQPPCSIRIVKTIWVEDMATVEAELHAVFKNQNVKLERSREWFDFSPLQYRRALWLMARHETHRFSFADIPIRSVVSGLLMVLGVGMAIGTVLQPDSQPAQKSAVQQQIK